MKNTEPLCRCGHEQNLHRGRCAIALCECKEFSVSVPTESRLHFDDLQTLAKLIARMGYISECNERQMVDLMEKALEDERREPVPASSSLLPVPERVTCICGVSFAENDAKMLEFHKDCPSARFINEGGCLRCGLFGRAHYHYCRPLQHYHISEGELARCAKCQEELSKRVASLPVGESTTEFDWKHAYRKLALFLHRRNGHNQFFERCEDSRCNPDNAPHMSSAEADQLRSEGELGLGESREPLPEKNQ